jgi:hypothetical protein
LTTSGETTHPDWISRAWRDYYPKTPIAAQILSERATHELPVAMPTYHGTDRPEGHPPITDPHEDGPVVRPNSVVAAGGYTILRHFRYADPRA